MAALFLLMGFFKVKITFIINYRENIQGGNELIYTFAFSYLES